eukprot:6896279-Alexandrium_andersonii.AAC.1
MGSKHAVAMSPSACLPFGLRALASVCLLGHHVVEPSGSSCLGPVGVGAVPLEDLGLVGSDGGRGAHGVAGG